MNEVIKIPDDVYETRCRWCLFFQREHPNIDQPGMHPLNYTTKTPCRIYSISQFTKVPEECLSFRAQTMFGICRYCEHHHIFGEPPAFCKLEPVNMRVVFQGTLPRNGTGSSTTEHCTCDLYTAAHFWRDYILKAVLDGRAPANFDPASWKATTPMPGTPISDTWERMRAGAEEQKAAEQRALELKKEQASDGQINIFD